MYQPARPHTTQHLQYYIRPLRQILTSQLLHEPEKNLERIQASSCLSLSFSKNSNMFKLRLELVVFVLLIFKIININSVGRSRALPEILRLSILCPSECK